jgi:hypothetical protein
VAVEIGLENPDTQDVFGAGRVAGGRRRRDEGDEIGC